MNIGHINVKMDVKETDEKKKKSKQGKRGEKKDAQQTSNNNNNKQTNKQTKQTKKKKQVYKRQKKEKKKVVLATDVVLFHLMPSALNSLWKRAFVALTLRPLSCELAATHSDSVVTMETAFLMAAAS